MAVRPTRTNEDPNKPCLGCPDKPQPSPPTHPLISAAALPLDQGQRLWKHVLFGTNTCIAIIHGYATNDMPGLPLPTLVAMRDQLTQIISHVEAQSK